MKETLHSPHSPRVCITLKALFLSEMLQGCFEPSSKQFFFASLVTFSSPENLSFCQWLLTKAVQQQAEGGQRGRGPVTHWGGSRAGWEDGLTSSHCLTAGMQGWEMQGSFPWSLLRISLPELHLSQQSPSQQQQLHLFLCNSLFHPKYLSSPGIRAAQRKAYETGGWGQPRVWRHRELPQAKGGFVMRLVRMSLCFSSSCWAQSWKVGKKPA